MSPLGSAIVSLRPKSDALRITFNEWEQDHHPILHSNRIFDLLERGKEVKIAETSGTTARKLEVNKREPRTTITIDLDIAVNTDLVTVQVWPIGVDVEDIEIVDAIRDSEGGQHVRLVVETDEDALPTGSVIYTGNKELRVGMLLEAVDWPDSIECDMSQSSTQSESLSNASSPRISPME